MGQRLVVTFFDGDESNRLAALYMHWNAYTDSALETTKSILDTLNGFVAARGVGKFTKQQLAVIAITNGALGSTFQRGEYKAFFGKEEPADYDTKRDRNNGIVAVTPDGIAELRNWAEGSVDIDLSDAHNPKIRFDVFFSEESLKEYAKEFGISEEEAKEQVGYVTAKRLKSLGADPSQWYDCMSYAQFAAMRKVFLEEDGDFRCHGCETVFEKIQ